MVMMRTGLKKVSLIGDKKGVNELVKKGDGLAFAAAKSAPVFEDTNRISASG
jgi:hypothetical protein